MTNKTKIYGNKVLREALVWAGQGKEQFKMGDTVPLVLSPNPCVYRSKMIDIKAGLGITVIPKEMLAGIHGLFSLGESSGLPTLPAIEIDLIVNEEKASDATARLAEHIIFALENNPSIGQAT